MINYPKILDKNEDFLDRLGYNTFITYVLKNGYRIGNVDNGYRQQLWYTVVNEAIDTKPP